MKTLKEIEFDEWGDDDKLISLSNHLRQAAREWVEKLEQQPLYYAIQMKGNQNLICWIKQFFNLEKEDKE